MLKHLRWLWAAHRAKRVYDRKGLLFSGRFKFMAELRPKLPGNKDRIAYPDAIFWITPADVRRAEQCTK